MVIKRFLKSAIVAGVFVIGLCPKAISDTPVAERGVLDLRDWDWQENPFLDLKGEWEFYWNQLLEPSDFSTIRTGQNYIKVPSAWNGEVIDGIRLPSEGYATYRLIILLDDSTRSYGLTNKAISSAFNIFLNGQLRASAGRVGSNRENSDPDYNHHVMLLPASDQVEVIVQVSNFDHRLGGLRDNITFGQEFDVFRQRGILLFISFFLGGSFLIMFIYHLAFYLINKNDKSPLYFAIFCLVLSIRLLVTGERPIELAPGLYPGWEASVKIEFMTLYAGIGLSLAYFKAIFGAVKSINWIKALYVLIIAACIIILFTPSRIYTRSLPFAEGLLAIVFFYTVIKSIQAIRKGNRDAQLFIAGFGLFMATIVNDILFVNEIIETGHYFSFGLFFFIVTQSILMGRKFSHTYRINEVLLQQVNEAKADLEIKINERTNELKNQNEALRKLNSEMDNFVYSVSHDLKAPLASVLGLLNLLGKEKNLDTIRDYNGMMKKSLHRLNEFIGDILDFSRNARLQISTDKINFKRLIDNVLDQYQYFESDVDISKRVEVDQNGTFISDRQRINVILNNLISNALKYSTLGNDGQPEISVEVKANSKLAKIIVTDNGSGIQEEHQDKIFNMFYRADSRKSGSGLGLYIVKETLEKINGRVELTSTFGKGTNVVIEIPNLIKGQHP